MRVFSLRIISCVKKGNASRRCARARPTGERFHFHFALSRTLVETLRSKLNQKVTKAEVWHGVKVSGRPKRWKQGQLSSRTVVCVSVKCGAGAQGGRDARGGGKMTHGRSQRHGRRRARARWTCGLKAPEVPFVVELASLKVKDSLTVVSLLF